MPTSRQRHVHVPGQVFLTAWDERPIEIRSANGQFVLRHWDREGEVITAEIIEAFRSLDDIFEWVDVFGDMHERFW